MKMLLEVFMVFIVVGVLVATFMCAFSIKRANAFEGIFKNRIHLDTIILIESSGDPLKFNKESGARGLMQITPICLRDFNENNVHHYTLDDLFNPHINKIVGEWYINKRIPYYLGPKKDTVKNRLWAYNAGIGKFWDGIKPQETVDYINKYEILASHAQVA